MGRSRGLTPRMMQALIDRGEVVRGHIVGGATIEGKVVEIVPSTPGTRGSIILETKVGRVACSVITVKW